MRIVGKLEKDPIIAIRVVYKCCVFSEMTGLLTNIPTSSRDSPSPCVSLHPPPLSLLSSLNRLLVCLVWLLVNMVQYQGADNGKT